MRANSPLWVLLLVLIGALIVIGSIIALYAIYYLSAPRECVGVIRIDGEIATSGSSGGILGSPTVGSDDIVSEIQDAESRSDVKAVVFEVNSPGGSVVASREIYDTEKEMKKPKVSYFRELAASGAYYISASSDYIVSDPDALTGSIGVVATFEDMSGLFQKLGLNYTIFKSGELKDMGTNTRPPTDEERQIMQNITDEIFDEFKEVVEVGRKGKLNETMFNEILDARVLTGRQALRVGLVDAVGDEKLAIVTAGNLANMTFTDEPPVCDLSNQNPFQSLFSGMVQGISSGIREIVGIQQQPVSVSYT